MFWLGLVVHVTCAHAHTYVRTQTRTHTHPWLGATQLSGQEAEWGRPLNLVPPPCPFTCAVSLLSRLREH